MRTFATCCKAISAVGVLLALLILNAATALAHGVYIFAWSDGPQICTESYFSKSSKVRGGRVIMRDAQGQNLHSAITNEQGAVCFPAPDSPQTLDFVVQAGGGHQGEFHLDAPAGNATSSARPAALPSSAVGVPATGDQAVLCELIRQELQAQLGPLRQALAEQRPDPGPRPKDIVGGIGWLLGLGALAHWWNGRKKK